MVQVIAPLFSLSASGLFGKTILYYDTKYGARARKIKGTFESPGNVWEVNKTWFKKASDRWKFDLPKDSKWAWNFYSEIVCDVGRDIFMGHQIEYWNMSPSNDLIWPVVDVKSIGPIVVAGYDNGDVAGCYIKEFNKELTMLYCPSTVWARKLDDNSPAVELDIVGRSQTRSYNIPFIAGHINYLWGGFRYTNGQYIMAFIGSFPK